MARLDWRFRLCFKHMTIHPSGMLKMYMELRSPKLLWAFIYLILMGDWKALGRLIGNLCKRK